MGRRSLAAGAGARGFARHLRSGDARPRARSDAARSRTARPRGQAEFVQTPADYIKEANIANLAAQGKKLATQHAQTLAAIEEKFGVPGNVLLAIWGRETAFGGYKLPKNAITVLATQGYYG